MAMQLVRKKNPTGGSIRWLRPDEEDAVKAYYSARAPLTTGELTLASSVLQEMRQKEAWLECDCVHGEHPARNSANLMKDTGTLFLAGFSHEHDMSCRMYRPFCGDEGATRVGTRKTAGSRRISYRDFLPPDDAGTTIKAPGRPTSISKRGFTRLNAGASDFFDSHSAASERLSSVPRSRPLSTGTGHPRLNRACA